MRDIHSNIASSLLLLKGRSALGVSGSANADLAGYDAAEILIGIKGTGATLGAAKNIKISILHGDTSTAATGAVATADLIGATATAGVILNINSSAAATGASGSTRIGYIGGKRHLKVKYVASGAATAATGANGIQLTVTVIKGNPAVAPVE